MGVPMQDLVSLIQGHDAQVGVVPEAPILGAAVEDWGERSLSGAQRLFGLLAPPQVVLRESEVSLGRE